MLVVLSNGSIKNVEESSMIIEKIIEFNGKRKFLSEEVNDLGIQPNAIRFYYKSIDSAFGFGNRQGFTIGNLTPHQIQKVFESIKKNEPIDFSSLVFQKSKNALSDYFIDGGISGAIYYDNSEILISYRSTDIGCKAEYGSIDMLSDDCSDDEYYDESNDCEEDEVE